MADIFLSYSREDRARVKPLAEAFESRGYSVWWDRHVPPGKSWSQLIEDELDAAKCVVVVWSKASVSSEWVEIEAAQAKQRGVLVPLMIDDVADDIPLEFSRLQAARLVEWEIRKSDSDFDLLMNTVADAVRRPQTPAAREQETISRRAAEEFNAAPEAARADRRPRAAPFERMLARASGFVRRRRKHLLLGAAAAAVFIGIPAAAYYVSLPTNQDVIDRYAARVDAKRDQLRAIANDLPPKGSVQVNTCSRAMDPKPVYDQKRNIFNTDIFMDYELVQEHLYDPRERFDFILTSPLGHVIAWRLGALSSDRTDDKDWGGEFARKFEQALSLRYLVVNRVVNHQSPDGKLDVETFLVDLHSGRQICFFPLSVEAGDDLYVRARESLRRELTEATGGTFTTDHP